MKMNKKRLLSIALMAAITITNINFSENVKAETVNSDNQGIEKLNITTENEELLKEDAKVRVIVELDKDSLIDEANAKNVDYSSLDDNFIREKKEELSKEQSEIVEEIEKSGIEADTSKIRNYDTILNGIALDVKASNLDELEEIKGVKNIYISEEFERPLLSSSGEIIGSGYANDSGYTGEGTVVAVIDSGIDYTHRAFRLDDESKARLNEADVNRIIAEKGLSGRYYTPKVPYGYNYYDLNTNLFDSYGVMHGMHVSGIVGANDNEKDLYGVAPNTQILALKVFSDDLQYPTTFTELLTMLFLSELMQSI